MAPNAGPKNTARTVATTLHVAWIAIALGLFLELLLVLVAAGFGTPLRVQPVVADTAQKITWSTIVCVGLAFGTTAAKWRSQLMGLLGLVSAPLAFVSARSVHKGLLDMLGESAAAGPSPVVVGSIKAIEYAFLGLALGALAKRAGSSLKAHLLIGLATGAVFGGTLVAYSVQASATPVPLPGLITRGINEIIFPVGCSLALFAGDVLAKRLEPSQPPPGG